MVRFFIFSINHIIPVANTVNLCQYCTVFKVAGLIWDVGEEWIGLGIRAMICVVRIMSCYYLNYYILHLYFVALITQRLMQNDKIHF